MQIYHHLKFQFKILNQTLDITECCIVGLHQYTIQGRLHSGGKKVCIINKSCNFWMEIFSCGFQQNDPLTYPVHIHNTQNI